MKSKLLLLFALALSSCAYSGEGSWQLIGPGDADQVTSLSITSNGALWAGFDVGGIYKSVDAGQSWAHQNERLNNLDVTTAIIEGGDRNTLYAGTRGGLYKSIDGGKTWALKRQGLPKLSQYKISASVGAIAIDKNNPSIMYMGLGYRPSYEGGGTVRRLTWDNKLYFSTDGGESWRGETIFPDNTRVNHIVISRHDNAKIFVATSAGIYRSVDKAKTWARVYEQEALNIIESRDSPGVLLAAVAKEGVIKSTDLGNSWAFSNGGLWTLNIGKIHTKRYCMLVVDEHDTNALYLVNSSWGRAGGLYRSEDFGASWNLVSRSMPESWLKTSKRFNAIVSDPAVKGRLFAGSSRYLYRSDNSGKSWTQLISRKSGDGWTHTGINVFGQTRQLYADIEDKDLFYIGTADHKMLKSSDAGKSWKLLMAGDKNASNIWDMAMCSQRPHVFYAVTSGNNRRLCLMRSEDKGETWDKNCGGMGNSDRYERILIDPRDCQKVYVATATGLIQTGDSGGSWRHIESLPRTKIYDLVYDKVNGFIYAATKQGLYRSVDQAKSWLKLYSVNKQAVTSIMVHSVNPNILLMGTESRGNQLAAIYRSEDSGKTWSPVLKDLNKYVTAFAELPANPDIIYSSTMDHNYHDISKGSGVFKSTDRGKTWTDVSDNLPVHRGYRISSSILHPNSIYFSTAGSGVYVRKEPK